MKRSRRAFGALFALALVATACGGSSDEASDTVTAEEEAVEEEAAPAGKTEITVTGPERSDEEAGALQDALNVWGDANGVTVTYLGDADWESNINTQVQAGNAPDISIVPQPGKLADFARAGLIVPLTDEVNASIEWSDAWKQFGLVDGQQYGVPMKSDLKSLVWYQPSRFAEAGYEVPTTFGEFTALVDKMAADGGAKPLCVGIESGTATGWTYTDWV